MRFQETDQIEALLVDDDQDLLDTSMMYLEREVDNININTDTNVDDALASIDDNEIHCIVSDYQMPGKDGLDFLEAVRAEYHRLPFILFTGKGSKEVAAKAINAGVDGYVQKKIGAGQYSLLANQMITLVEKFWAELRLDRLMQKVHLLDGDKKSGTDERNYCAPITEATDDSMSIAVVKAVAKRKGVDPIALPPLYETIDPEILDAVGNRQSNQSNQPSQSVTFDYQGYCITVSSDGQIHLDT